MDAIEQRQNQYIALFLVILGLCATAVGCHFRWPELTTASAGVWGGGLGLLKGSTNSSTNRGTGNLSVAQADSPQ